MGSSNVEAANVGTNDNFVALLCLLEGRNLHIQRQFDGRG